MITDIVVCVCMVLAGYVCGHYFPIDLIVSKMKKGAGK